MERPGTTMPFLILDWVNALGGSPGGDNSAMTGLNLRARECHVDTHLKGFPSSRVVTLLAYVHFEGSSLNCS